MRNIKQKIRANAESICKTCIHSNVCWAIDNQPCEECNQYEPVKHGRWVESAGGRTICNKCGEYPLYDYFGRLKLSTACPNCGAKMDGGSDNV